MWTRAQLKAKAKYTFKLNRWKIIFVSLFALIIVGTAGGGFSYSFGNSNSSMNYKFDNQEIYYNSGNSFGDSFMQGFEYGYNNAAGKHHNDSFQQFDRMMGEEIALPEGITEKDLMFIVDNMVWIVLITILVAVPIIIAISLLWAGFIQNPIEVGTKRFFFKSLGEKAEVKETMYAFDNNYKNVAGVMIWRTVYQLLWTLLFIIPGIVKAYEYRMIPYLLAENPNLTKEQAFALSKQMMDGNKWSAFVLDLSFLGWEILSALTLGILGVLYVNPYKNMTDAALYEELSLEHGRPAMNEPAGGYYEYAYNENSKDESKDYI